MKTPAATHGIEGVGERRGHVWGEARPALVLETVHGFAEHARGEAGGYSARLTEPGAGDSELGDAAAHFVEAEAGSGAAELGA
eukprot:CAMPEP_0172638650 /NCGR_PEP_ID=MMETSP1068-20121228/214841_1 /TAXON_ID=35684 /ORGANISM="Pseudopedinella elastica, Strain CCMP716" /LENGTH=82 /DNA_ID=CAMNT_0013451589 /DNA_START=140 /DNA_END=385 /DNA_ORIENTATION=+